jgi:hypothetical protein
LKHQQSFGDKPLEDNMSISEIIKRRFKPKIKLNKFKEAKDVAKFIIEDPDAANKD